MLLCMHLLIPKTATFNLLFSENIDILTCVGFKFLGWDRSNLLTYSTSFLLY